MMTTNAKDNDDDDDDDDDDDILKGGAWIQLILQSLAYHDHNDNQYDYDDYHIKYDDDDDDDDNDILKGGAGIWLVLKSLALTIIPNMMMMIYVHYDQAPASRVF